MPLVLEWPRGGSQSGFWIYGYYDDGAAVALTVNVKLEHERLEESLSVSFRNLPVAA
jgi:hypothetical protein